MRVSSSDRDALIHSLTGLPTYWRATASPDGNQLAYYYDRTGRFELYTQNIETGTRHRLTNGELPRDPKSRIRWGSDNDRVYVHLNDPDTDIYEIQLATGEINSVIVGDGRYQLWDVDTTGRYLLYTHREEAERTLYRYDRTQDSHTQLTNDKFVFARGNEFDSSGEYVVFSVTDVTADPDLSTCRVVISAADGSNREQIPVGDPEDRTLAKAWGPAGNQILLYETYGKGRSGVYDRRTGDVTWYGDGNRQEKPVTFLPDGERFLAIRKDRIDTIPIVYTTDGHRRELNLEGVVPLDPTASWDHIFSPDEVLLPHGTTTQKSRLIRYEISTDTVETVADIDYTDINPESFIAGEYVTFESFDGLEIGGLWYDPCIENDPIPAVVIVHGGPHELVARNFHLGAQLLAQSGYVVFLPNYRGSTGRGTDFKQRLFGDIGGGEAKDVAAAGRWVAQHSRVDQHRIGLYGHSYGGYLVYLQMVLNPRLWGVGVASNGITSLENDTSYPSLPGLAAMDADLRRERSPINHVDALERPLLMLHGVDDPACSIENAHSFHKRLQAAGYEEDEDFEYHELDEPHGTLDQERKRRRWELVLDFIGRRL